MPVHDWTLVDAGTFHDFHHGVIEDIKRSLNSELLPEGYYAMAEQRTAKYGPDVLTLQLQDNALGSSNVHSTLPGENLALLETPVVELTGETDMGFYRRKQNLLAIRHVSGNELMAVVEIVSPGNKSSQRAMRAFVEKAGALLEQGIHLLVVDLLPPTPRDPQGIHGAIWEEISGELYESPPATPLTVAAYEVDLSIRAYVDHLAVGGKLKSMPLFLQPRQHVEVPLERLYQQAFNAVPRHLQQVLNES